MSGIAIAVAGVLAFTGITANKFWDDEANTAIFAQNLLDTGQLSAWNGTNLIGYRDGAELDENAIPILERDGESSAKNLFLWSGRSFITFASFSLSTAPRTTVANPSEAQ